jgi:hypothetical protein
MLVRLERRSVKNIIKVRELWLHYKSMQGQGTHKSLVYIQTPSAPLNLRSLRHPRGVHTIF